jgi:hypothetical protein
MSVLFPRRSFALGASISERELARIFPTSASGRPRFLRNKNGQNSKSTNFCVNTAPIIVNTSNTTPNRHLLAFAFIKQNVSAVQRCWAQAVNVGGGGGSTASSVFFRCAGHVGLLSP